jgi:hypothetical protein
LIEDLQIDEENPDVQEIMLQIRGVIARNKLGPNRTARKHQRYTRLGQPVYDHLFQALGAYDQPRVKAFVSPTSVPLIGPLLQRLRQSAHNLVIFYLDRLSDKQIHFNEQLVRTVNRMVQDLEEEPDPAGVQAQLATLQERVASLEAQLARLNGQGE